MFSMLSSCLTNLFKHEFSESPDLLAVLWVIHDVVLHEKGLRADKTNIILLMQETVLALFCDSLT